MNPEEQSQKNVGEQGMASKPLATVSPDEHTYQYSQVNYTEPPRLPDTMLPTIGGQSPSKIPINSKIGPLTNWLIAVVILVAYFILVVGLSDEAWRVFAGLYWPIVTSLLGMHVSKINKSDNTALDDKNRTAMVAFMAANVVIAQAVYYFALKKRKPAIAHTASRLGWKMLGIWLVVAVAFFGTNILTSWGVQHAGKFNEGLRKISQEGQAMVELAQNNTVDMYEVKQRCQNIVEHIHDMKEIPEHPKEEIQAKIAEGENEIEKGGDKCAKAAESNDEYLMKEAGEHMKKGVGALQAAVKAHNES